MPEYDCLTERASDEGTNQLRDVKVKHRGRLYDIRGSGTQGSCTKAG